MVENINDGYINGGDKNVKIDIVLSVNGYKRWCLALKCNVILG